MNGSLVGLRVDYRIFTNIVVIYIGCFVYECVCVWIVIEAIYPSMIIRLKSFLIIISEKVQCTGSMCSFNTPPLYLTTLHPCATVMRLKILLMYTVRPGHKIPHTCMKDVTQIPEIASNTFTKMIINRILFKPCEHTFLSLQYVEVSSPLTALNWIRWTVSPDCLWNPVGWEWPYGDVQEEDLSAVLSALISDCSSKRECTA